MKTDICVYSGFKIYPGHGKRLVKLDGKVLSFITKKCTELQAKKKNPREVRWTQLYRKKHKKDSRDEHKKRRARQIKRTERAIQGTTLLDIASLRHEKPELRKIQRDAAIKAAKKKKMIKTEEKKIKKDTEKHSKKQRKPVAVSNVKSRVRK